MAIPSAHILTMVLGCMDRLTTERPRSASIVRYMRFPDSSKDASGIFGHTGERCVAVYGTDAEKLQAWMVGSEEDGEGVL